MNGETGKSNNCDYPNLVLAFLGDAYFELLVRERIVKNSPGSSADHSREALSYVTAASQSLAVERLLPHLTLEEEAVFRRGRNAKSPHTPRSATKLDYRRATGLEALFGWLYIKGETTRAVQLFDLSFPL
ncbi:MAG: ribonuclease III domain-containing protein [Eubacteriales bacterium]